MHPNPKSRGPSRAPATSRHRRKLPTDTDVLVTDPDGWTLRSATGARTAHTEHTVAITGDGVEVLTLPR
jgi:methionine aminopeptidase